MKDRSTEDRPSSRHHAEIRVPQIQVQIQAPQIQLSQPSLPYYRSSSTPPAISPRPNLSYRNPTPFYRSVGSFASHRPILIMARGPVGPEIEIDDDEEEDSEED